MVVKRSELRFKQLDYDGLLSDDSLFEFRRGGTTSVSLASAFLGTKTTAATTTIRMLWSISKNILHNFYIVGNRI